jgi:hypothetical protein
MGGSTLTMARVCGTSDHVLGNDPERVLFIQER